MHCSLSKSHQPAPIVNVSVRSHYLSAVCFNSTQKWHRGVVSGSIVSDVEQWAMITASDTGCNAFRPAELVPSSSPPSLLSQRSSMKGLGGTASLPVHLQLIQRAEVFHLCWYVPGASSLDELMRQKGAELHHHRLRQMLLIFYLKYFRCDAGHQ